MDKVKKNAFTDYSRPTATNYMMGAQFQAQLVCSSSPSRLELVQPHIQSVPVLFTVEKQPELKLTST
jgi:hypothetical protein